MWMTIDKESKRLLLQEKEYISHKKQTGCPKQENRMPPMAAETMITTKSEINLHAHKQIVKHVYKEAYLSMLR